MTGKTIEIKDQKPKTENHLWIIVCVLVTAVAAFWRFWDLTLKPLHHDEGVNGHFLMSLFRDGAYRYDPSNYHGPTLYYISLTFCKVFGNDLDTFSVRASMAVFGVLMAAMALFLRKYIGTVGSICAALFIALSPGMVYISRYFIHEIFFVFCSFGIVLGVLFFIEGRKPGIFAISSMTFLILICFIPPVMNVGNLVDENNQTLVWIMRIGVLAIEAFLVFLLMRMLLDWDEGRPIYLLLASASTALFFATKETAFITLGTMLIALGCVFHWRMIILIERPLTDVYYKGAVILLIGLAMVNLIFFRVDVVYYAIGSILLIYLGSWGLAWFLRKNKFGLSDKANLDELAPVKMTWTQFREKTKATDNREFLLVVSGIGAAVIFLMWFLSRILIDLLLAWVREKGVSATWAGITFSTADYVILGLGVCLLVFSIRGLMVDKPPQISQHFVILSLVTTLVFVYVGILFFSSFFTYPEGIGKAFEAYAIWTKTGNTDHTQNGYLAYANWMRKVESPIVVLSVVGTLIAFLKGRHIFAMFVALWAFGLFAAYTIIPYKTPWLALSFLLPMCLVAGYGINEIYKSRDTTLKAFAGLLTIFAVSVLGYQTYDLNFQKYDDDQMPYVYAHTTRGFLDLVKKIEYYAQKGGRGKDATIEIVSPDYWSMPWYTRNYENANYHGKIVTANTAEMIVAKKDLQEAEIANKYGAHYKKEGEYPLRPGVDLILLVRRDLAEANSEEVYPELLEPAVVEVTPEPTPEKREQR